MHSTCRVFYGSGKFCSAVFRLIEVHLIDISKLIYYDLILIFNSIIFAGNMLFPVNLMPVIVTFKRDL